MSIEFDKFDKEFTYGQVLKSAELNDLVNYMNNTFSKFVNTKGFLPPEIKLVGTLNGEHTFRLINYGAEGTGTEQFITIKDGTTPTISINADGYWVINDTKLPIKAEGVTISKIDPVVDNKITINFNDGKTANIPIPNIQDNIDGQKEWYVGNEPTTVIAKGETGNSLKVLPTNFVVDDDDPYRTGTTVEIQTVTPDGTLVGEPVLLTVYDGKNGEPGTGIEIKGVYASKEELPVIGGIGDAYLVGQEIFIWDANTGHFVTGGNIKGVNGDTITDVAILSDGTLQVKIEKSDGTPGYLTTTGTVNLQVEDSEYIPSENKVKITYYNNTVTSEIPVPHIGEDGYWYVGDTSTDVKAEGTSGGEEATANGTKALGYNIEQYNHRFAYFDVTLDDKEVKISIIEPPSTFKSRLEFDKKVKIISKNKIIEINFHTFYSLYDGDDKGIIELKNKSKIKEKGMCSVFYNEDDNKFIITSLDDNNYTNENFLGNICSLENCELNSFVFPYIIEKEEFSYVNDSTSDPNSKITTNKYLIHPIHKKWQDTKLDIYTNTNKPRTNIIPIIDYPNKKIIFPKKCNFYPMTEDKQTQKHDLSNSVDDEDFNISFASTSFFQALVGDDYSFKFIGINEFRAAHTEKRYPYYYGFIDQENKISHLNFEAKPKLIYFSILGDSVSTHEDEDYVGTDPEVLSISGVTEKEATWNAAPNDDKATVLDKGPEIHYASGGILPTKNDIWWGILEKQLGWKLCSNNSWSGSGVCFDITKSSVPDNNNRKWYISTPHTDIRKPSEITIKSSKSDAENGEGTNIVKPQAFRRISALKKDEITPDVIFVELGGNDFIKQESFKNANYYYLDIFDKTGIDDLTVEEIVNNFNEKEVLHNFYKGYVHLLNKIQQTYPKAKIFAFTFFFCDPQRATVHDQYTPPTNSAGTSLITLNNLIKKACELCGVEVIDLYTLGYSRYNAADYFHDYQKTTGGFIHQNKAGMKLWGDKVVAYLKNRCELI